MILTRPEIDLVIPVEAESKQLEVTVESIQKYTSGYRLHIVKEPALNVSEARQKAMDEVVKGDFICFLDYDSEMIQQGWLDNMYESLLSKPDAGAVYGGEWWGTEEPPEIVTSAGDHAIEYGPAACMLMDRTRIPAEVKWDPNIGLRNGWLGGDFEEVDFAFQLAHRGLQLYRSTATLFHHTGGRTSFGCFRLTDRQRTVVIMEYLIRMKYIKAPKDVDYFKGLKYVKAVDTDDTKLAKGANLRECYHNIVVKNGLQNRHFIKQMGLD